METRTDLTAFARKTGEIKQRIAEIIVGQTEAVDLLLTCVIADGHVLLEGVPGVAKTLLARLVSRLIDARFSRVQFTPDLMPSDVLGTSVFNMKTSEFDFHPGPAFADIVLADEINRAPAKTQAALFEVMEERQATIDGTSYVMGDVYTIIATQNPVEHEGTYRLPEAQLDRFLMKLSIGYPDRASELAMLGEMPQRLDVKPVMTLAEIMEMRAAVERIDVSERVKAYILMIVSATRSHGELKLGASPRGSIALYRAAQAMAFMNGRAFATPDDIKAVAHEVLSHRLITPSGKAADAARQVITEILAQTPVPA